MLFMHGKDREYERSMQEKPNWNRGKGSDARKYAPFRYKYSDIKCDYCIHRGKCDYIFCPAIMDNLDDLMYDDDFINALDNADQCETPHKTALITVKERYRNGLS